MLKKNKIIETFNDGVLVVCEKKARAITKTIHPSIRFSKKTIGVTRHYQAKIASEKIDKLLAIPKYYLVEKDNIIHIDGNWFEIKHIQEKNETIPPIVLLSLSYDGVGYRDERVKDT